MCELPDCRRLSLPGWCCGDCAVCRRCSISARRPSVQWARPACPGSACRPAHGACIYSASDQPLSPPHTLAAVEQTMTMMMMMTTGLHDDRSSPDALKGNCAAEFNATELNWTESSSAAFILFISFCFILFRFRAVTLIGSLKTSVSMPNF